MIGERLLFENEHFRVSIRDDEPMVTVVRSSKSFESSKDAELSFAPMLATLAPFAAGDHVLLLDTRDAVGKNDPVYESWYEEGRKALLAMFMRTAVLNKTAIGRLHTRRLMNHDHHAVVAEAFTDIYQAVRYLRSGIRESRRPPDQRSASSR